MTRHSHLKWLVLLAGLVAVSASGLLAASGSATIVCPQGVKPPSPYCVNVPPIAITRNASHVRATSARLNGIAGPNVRGGDVTQYYFEYGTTTLYGSQTRTGTVGSCPFGVTPPSPYCNVPKKQRVSADIWRLTPCTTYHFQLVAQNPDGMTDGGDNTFTTRFAPPLAGVFAPSVVRAGDTFQVFFGLRYDTDSVTILLAAPYGGVVQSVNLGSLSAGRYTQTLNAPNRRGDYVLVVLAKLSCGRQSVVQRLRVDGRGRFGF
ncbi:MAG TPA: hypothetical protein VME22_05070 [Solirubrobacteraceae bacterium]|nr:hypothetical protein [Solirubrobacteraceae bacterium]